MAKTNLAPEQRSGVKRKSIQLADGTSRKKKATPVPLYFPLATRAFLTSFRVNVLNTIYEIASNELGNRIKSAVVLAEADYEEPDHVALVLAIWADVGQEEWRHAFRAISEAVFDEETRWTESERDDFVNAIQFEILPLNL